jgi:hypothetical protein
MRTIVLAGLLTAAAAYAIAQEPLPDRPAPAPVKPTALPSEDAIRAAVRETLAEKPDNPRLHEADTYRANHYDIFARKVEDATVPDCLHEDGLKRQPTFFLGGLLALPFIAVAKVRGKCQ